MVSFDVVSLFTSILIELALQVVEQRLVQDSNLTTRTGISINNIIYISDLPRYYNIGLVNINKLLICISRWRGGIRKA